MKKDSQCASAYYSINLKGNAAQIKEAVEMLDDVIDDQSCFAEFLDELQQSARSKQEYPDTIGVFTKRDEQIGFIGNKDLNELRGLYAHNKASVTVSTIEHSERGLGVDMLIKIYK